MTPPENGAASPSRFSSVCFGYLVLCFLLLHPFSIRDRNLVDVSSFDETSYLAHATSVAFGQFPDYSKEYLRTFAGNYAFGPGFVAAPFVWALSTIDRKSKSDIVAQRTEATVRAGWAPFGFVVSTQVLLMVGLYFLWRACREAGGARPATAVFATTASTGLPNYAFRAPVNSHMLEFAAGSFLLYLLFSAKSGNRRYGAPLWTGVIVSGLLLYLTRYNDVVMAFIFGFAALQLAPRGETLDLPRRRLRDTIGLLLALCAAAIAARQLIGTLTPQTPTDFWMPGHLQERLMWRGVRYYLGRTAYVFAGSDWGLLYTAPLILLGFVGLRRLRPAILGLLLAMPLAINLFMAISWTNNGASYGYRYFVFAALPLATVGVSLWMADRTERFRAWTVWALSLFPLACVLVFSSGDGFFISEVNNRWGQAWSIDHFVRKVAAALIAHPLTTFGWVRHCGVLDCLFYDWGAATKIKWALASSVPMIALVAAFFGEKAAGQWKSDAGGEFAARLESSFYRFIERLRGVPAPGPTHPPAPAPPGGGDEAPPDARP